MPVFPHPARLDELGLSTSQILKSILRQDSQSRFVSVRLQRYDPILLMANGNRLRSFPDNRIKLGNELAACENFSRNAQTLGIQCC
jgi:hypothetical protein